MISKYKFSESLAHEEVREISQLMTTLDICHRGSSTSRQKIFENIIKDKNIKYKIYNLFKLPEDIDKVLVPYQTGEYNPKFDFLSREQISTIQSSLRIWIKKVLEFFPYLSENDRISIKNYVNAFSTMLGRFIFYQIEKTIIFVPGYFNNLYESSYKRSRSLNYYIQKFETDEYFENWEKRYNRFTNSTEDKEIYLSILSDELEFELVEDDRVIIDEESDCSIPWDLSIPMAVIELKSNDKFETLPDKKYEYIINKLFPACLIKDYTVSDLYYSYKYLNKVSQDFITTVIPDLVDPNTGRLDNGENIMDIYFRDLDWIWDNFIKNIGLLPTKIIKIFLTTILD